MADLVSEIMEIDSDDDSSQSPAPKKTKNEEKMEDEEIEKKNNEIEKKTDEIILIDSEEDDEKEKEEDDVKIVPAKTVKREPPTVQPEIIDLNDDDEEPIKKVFTPKVDESLEKREGLIIKNVEEITKVKIEEGMDVEETVIKKEKGTEEKKNDGEEGKCKGEGAKKEEEEDDEIRVEKVVDLETQANRRKCLNSGCKSGVGLEICKESCIFTFYGMRPRGKQLVCRECLRLAEEHFEKLVSMLKENKPLFSANFPRGSDVVLLDDSDDSDVDEFEGEEVELDEEVSRIVGNSNLLESLIKETMDKCGYDKQMEENEKLLKEDAQNVEDTLKDLNERFEKVFNKMVDMHNQIYDAFKPATKSVSPIEIVHNLDFESPPPAVVPSHHQHASSMKLGGLSSAVMPRAPPLANQSAGGGGQGGSSRMVAMKKVTQYSPNKPKPSTSSAVASEQDIVALDSAPTSLPQLPPIGVVERPKLSKGDSVYVMRQTLFTAWGLAEVLEIMPKSADNGPDNTQLRIAYDLHKRVPPTKLTSAKLVAYSQPSAVRLPVGSRVIAVYRGDDDVITSDPSPSANHYFYSGIVAEAPKINNKFRYLVFFDDGYTQYVLHENIRLVCESSKNVWEDVHPESKQFIKDYLTRYPERPMVKLSIDEIVKTEWNGKWWVARVQAIDASLVKMYFDADERTEWIYRGSTRLGPLYIEMIAARDRQSGRTHRHAGILKRQNPYVEYTQNIDEGSSDDDVELVKEETLQPARSVARKSTNPKNQNQKPETVYHRVGPMDISVKPKQFIRQQHPGVISKVSLANAPKPRPFTVHNCNNSCIAWTDYRFEKSKEIPCLLRPLMFGFQRLFYTRKSKPFVVYVAPCGRRVRSHDEIVKYLFRTKSQLSCDYFDFDPWVSCVNEYKLPKSVVNSSVKDLSYGKENVSIECVNYVDCTYPDFVYYQTERRAMENVKLNTEPEFLAGCNCTDNCQDRSKCSCWQLTITGAKCIPGLDFDENTIGYQYRRLPERVVSGIYECNSQCKCSKTCMNRVAQFPISVKLQLYKTLMKGWGIRCLHDIPQGSFICIYAGNLLTEQAANEGGKTYGDEYLAELDFIEVIESLKEDYESDVPESSEEEEEEEDNASNKNKGKRTSKEDKQKEEEEEEEEEEVERGKKGNAYESRDKTFSVGSSRASVDTGSNMRDRLRTRKTKDTDSDDSESKNEKSRKPNKFQANIDEKKKTKKEEEEERKSVREYYGDDSCNIYVMDAKNGGNIGRYMNHSCNPNVFVQNVFVDTHDLRFPWVAFFASRFIEAGQELTWDYNYDVGSVPGKALYCYCGEANCRRRLL